MKRKIPKTKLTDNKKTIKKCDFKTKTNNTISQIRLDKQ